MIVVAGTVGADDGTTIVGSVMVGRATVRGTSTVRTTVGVSTLTTGTSALMVRGSKVAPGSVAWTVVVPTLTICRLPKGRAKGTADAVEKRRVVRSAFECILTAGAAAHRRGRVGARSESVAR